MRTNVLQLLAAASMSASGIIMPIYAVQIGASIETVGWIGAIFGLTSFLSNLLFGRLGDTLDRKRILQWGFLAGAVAFALQYFATTPTQFLVARGMVGFTVGMLPPALAAYVYQVRRPLGKFTSYNAAGWLLASLLVVGVGALTGIAFDAPFLELFRLALLNLLGPYRLIFLLSAFLCLLGFFLTIELPGMHLGLRLPLFPFRVLTRNSHVYLSLFIRNFGAAGIWTIFPLYIVSIGGDLAMIGWVHIVNMATQIVILRNVERWGRLGNARWLIAVGLLLSAATFWAFTWAQDALHLLPMQIALGISFACLWLGSLKEVMEHNVERATATGLLNGMLSLSNVVGPLWGAAVAALYGFHATMLVAALITAVAFALYLLLPTYRPEPPELLHAPAGGPAGDVVP